MSEALSAMSEALSAMSEASSAMSEASSAIWLRRRQRCRQGIVGNVGKTLSVRLVRRCRRCG